MGTLDLRPLFPALCVALIGVAVLLLQAFAAPRRGGCALS